MEEVDCKGMKFDMDLSSKANKSRVHGRIIVSIFSLFKVG